MVWLWLIIIAIALWFVYYYNRIIILRNRISNALSQIDVQLKKRADLVPNLVETVKGYMKHERSLLLDITRARAEMAKAKTLQHKINASNKLAAGLKTLFALAENYPKLMASKNFLHLQEELTSIEEKIAYTRQAYNDAVLEYNNTIQTIPGKWIAAMIKARPMQYLQIEGIERKPIKVKF